MNRCPPVVVILVVVSVAPACTMSRREMIGKGQTLFAAPYLPVIMNNDINTFQRCDRIVVSPPVVTVAKRVAHNLTDDVLQQLAVSSLQREFNVTHSSRLCTKFATMSRTHKVLLRF